MCRGGKGMEYVRTDPDTGKHLYRCPSEGCGRVEEIRGRSTCFDSHWKTQMTICAQLACFLERARNGSCGTRVAS